MVNDKGIIIIIIIMTQSIIRKILLAERGHSLFAESMICSAERIPLNMVVRCSEMSRRLCHIIAMAV